MSKRFEKGDGFWISANILADVVSVILLCLLMIAGIIIIVNGAKANSDIIIIGGVVVLIFALILPYTIWIFLKNKLYHYYDVKIIRNIVDSENQTNSSSEEGSDE